MGPELPAMLYKPGSTLEWDGEMFDYLVVSSEDDLKAALADGWSIGKPEGGDPAVEGDTKPRRGRPPKDAE